MHSDRIRGNIHKLQNRKSQLDIREKKKSHYGDDLTLEHVAQKGWGIFILGSSHNSTGAGPEQHDLV